MLAGEEGFKKDGLSWRTLFPMLMPPAVFFGREYKHTLFLIRSLEGFA